MKKFLSAIVLLLVFALTFTMLTSCDVLNNLLGNENADNGDDNKDNTNPPADDNKVTVCWYQGAKALKEEEVDKGTILTPWTPEVDGKTFQGWFAEASLSTAFDFTKPIEADTDIFAAFKSDEYVSDETSYYLIGAGAGDMGKANWDHTNAAANLTMTKEDVENANVYTITITMYAGDMFQICHDGSWDGQTGIGYVEGAEYCNGVNSYDKKEYTAEDKKVAQVLNAEGEAVFVGSDEYNKGFESWNITLAPGMDGIYKFTFTTFPGAATYNKITFELVEKLDAQEVTHDMYFIGTHNEWSSDFTEGAEWHLAESTDKATWTGILTVTEDMYADWTATDPGNPHGVACAAVKLYNTVNGNYFSPDGNNIFLTAGTYAFKYTVDGDVVEYAACNYYLVGTFLDENGAAVNFSVKAGVTPALTVSEDGKTASCTFTAVDVTSVGDFSWIADQGKPGVMAFKVVFGSELGISTWYSDTANGGDNFYANAGEVTVTLDIETGAVTVA